VLQVRTRDELEEICRRDPGDPAFIEFSLLHQADGRLADALLICVQGVGANPDSLCGRALLSELLFRAGSPNLAARELQELQQLAPQNEVVPKILAKLGIQADGVSNSGAQTAAAEQSEIAEVELDADDLEEL
jgi:predicted Zn-dependent protease